MLSWDKCRLLRKEGAHKKALEKTAQAQGTRHRNRPALEPCGSAVVQSKTRHCVQSKEPRLAKAKSKIIF